MDASPRTREPEAPKQSASGGSGSSSGLKRFFPATPKSAADARPTPPSAQPQPGPKRAPARRIEADADAALDLGLEIGAPAPRESHTGPGRDAAKPAPTDAKKPNKLIDGIFGVLRKGKKKS